MMHFQVYFGLTVLVVWFHMVPAQIVNTTLGVVQGINLTSRSNRSFSAFLGIPYAVPPLGHLRFQDPHPHEGWSDIRDASHYGNVCPQFSASSERNFTGDEDCLTINVFTPYNLGLITKDDLLPVLVYIHGGYFMVFSGSHYGPRYFMDHDVVLVTFNYRLGAFGFLNTQDSNASGNAGMKDQVLALKWVQTNIEHFGGDPTRVTLYGESAGSAAVNYHLLSPMSNGLFSAAISSSGTAFKVLSIQLSPLDAARQLAKETGCESFVGSTKEMVECLRSLDVSTIASQGYELFEVIKDPLRIYCPSIENNSSGSSSEPFLTRHPYDVLQEGQQRSVPWMIGVNSGEGLITTLGIYESSEWTQELNSNWDALAPDLLIYDKVAANLTNRINEFYLKVSANEKVDFRRDMQGFTNIFSDRLYIDASLEAVRLQSQVGPVFLYFNNYSTQANIYNFGTTHGEELQLLFSPANFSHPLIDEGHLDYEQSQIMVDLWAQFVIDPFNVNYNEIKWKSVDPALNYTTALILSNIKTGPGGQQITILPEAITRRVEFWRSHGVPPYQEVHPPSIKTSK